MSAPEETRVFDELEKSRRNLSERYPEKEPGDRAYDATRLVFSLFPNGVATELLSLILTAPVVRRRDEWVVEVASAVDDILKWKEGLSIENLHQKRTIYIRAYSCHKDCDQYSSSREAGHVTQHPSKDWNILRSR
jgi:hypothetical protein